MKCKIRNLSPVELLEPRRLLAALDPTLPGGFSNIVPQSDRAVEIGDALALRDGGLLLGGTSLTGSDRGSVERPKSIRLVRYLPDGTLNQAFGDGGVADLSVPLAGAHPAGLIERPDGRLVLLCWTRDRPESGTPGRALLVGIRADGAIDTSFGVDGLAISPPEFNFAYATNLLQFSDGTLLTGGSNNIIRFTADGALDSSFADRGVYPKVFPYGGTGYMRLSLTSDGKLLGSGTYGAAYIIDPATLAATRLWNPERTAIKSYVAAADGKVILVPYPTNRQPTVLQRINPDGSVDLTFGDAGQIKVRGLESFNVHVDKFGRINIVYFTNSELDRSIFLTRFRANGKLDRSFGDAGRSSITVESGERFSFRQTSALNDGRAYLIGEASEIRNVVLRTGRNGGIDPTFAGGRAVTATSAGEQGSIVALRDAGDGRTLVVGSTSSPAGALDFYLARYLPDGTNDATFGVGGVTTLDIDRSSDRACRVVVDAQGRIYVAGTSGDEAVVARFSPSGIVDSTFAVDGVFRYQQAHSPAQYDLQLDSQGRVVFGGFNNAPSGEAVQSFVGRLRSDGTLDPSFSVDGLITGEGVLGRFSLNAIVVQSGDRIVLGGESGGAFFATRLLADGTLDRHFCANGVMRLDRDPSSPDLITRLVELGDGRLLATGRGRNGPVALRLSRDGVVDQAFPGARKGAVEVEVGASDIVPDGDGYLLSGGSSVLRLGSEGAIDRTFGDQGVLRFEDQRQRNLLDRSYITTASRVSGRINLAGTFGDGIGPLFRQAGAPSPPLGTTLTPGGTLRIVSGAGNDGVSVTLDGSRVVSKVNGEVTTFESSGVSRILLFSGPGHDQILVDAGFRPATIIAGGGNDTIATGEGNEYIDAEAGDDWVSPGAGGDSISGGSGANTLSFESFRGAIHVSAGGDGLTYDARAGGRYAPNFGLHFDQLIATPQADEIGIGEGGFRRVLAGGGNDRIVASAPVEIFAEGGDDTVLVGSEYDRSPPIDGPAVVDGGSGDDDLSVRAIGGAVYGRGGDDTLFVAGKQVEAFGGGGIDTATWAEKYRAVHVDLDDLFDDGVPGEQLNIHSDIENLVGSYGSDLLVGSGADNSIDGWYGGGDTLEGRGGNDLLSVNNTSDQSCTLVGGTGDDTLRAFNFAVDFLDGGAGNDSAEIDRPAEFADRTIGIEIFEAR